MVERDCPMITLRRFRWVLPGVGAAVLLGGPRVEAAGESKGVVIATSAVPWEQVDPALSFTVFVEREEYTTLDRVGRWVFAVQTGKAGGSPTGLVAEWELKQGARKVAEGKAPLDQGLADVRFRLTGLEPGRYTLSASLMRGQERVQTREAFFRYLQKDPPAQQGRVALTLPRGVPISAGTYPLHGGVPFPKGALWDEKEVRVVKADGTLVPCGTVVRSRWGSGPESSIRWLGVDFQGERAPAWWPERKDIRYYVEYGNGARNPAVLPGVKAEATAEGIEVDTGVLRFLVRKQGFNLIDQVVLNGQRLPISNTRQGAYLVDQDGAVYRAANDKETKVTVEEQTALRVVIRAEGWYVKDGATGDTVDYKLPTDKLCRFVTRIEAYAGQPTVRILHTWILTFDSGSVRLKDVGLNLSWGGGLTQAEFGVEGERPIAQPVPANGVRLVQHLPQAFVVEDGDGRKRVEGKHSAGWVVAQSKDAVVGVGHRETWQRFPKELEVLPGGITLHVWPAHGREHPEIDELAQDQMHKLWFAHQGRELNMVQPWEYYFAAAEIEDDPTPGIYKGAGIALAGVYASAMGAAVSSDLMLHFALPGRADEVRERAACFQVAPPVLPDPRWLCDESLAIGYVHAYDPEHMRALEDIAENALKGYWETMQATQCYGMWIYSPWFHGSYLGGGKWPVYRHFSATHHYDAFMPWLFYARSGDPLYLTFGQANIRQLSDVQMIHYDNPAYSQREFHFGQGRIKGSTRHTNGFNTWGGDHALLAHLTCYNSLILAHYLTGDLRLREVLVEEWQQTLVADRKNPEFAKADRSRGTGMNSARDNSNALGELIDLYQMTYHPALLAHMAPMMDIFVNQFTRHWGQPTHNVLQFYGSAALRTHLLAAVRTNIDNAAQGKSPKGDYESTKALGDHLGFWFTHAPHENFALAAILDPNANYQVNAFLASEPGSRKIWAENIRRQVPRAFPACALPDYVLYLPRVMYALAHAQGGVSNAAGLVASQAMPTGDMKMGGWLRCIVRKAQEPSFVIRINGICATGLPVRVFAPDGKRVLDVTMPPGSHAPFEIAVPPDGQTGDYVILVKARDNRDNLTVPFTTLPEVYAVSHWGQNDPARFFTRSRGAEPEPLEIRPYKGAGQILDRAGTKALALTDNGESLKTVMGPEGVWILMTSRYVYPIKPAPVILSVSPQKWFLPSAETLNIKP
jgi:hypothetical protein